MADKITIHVFGENVIDLEGKLPESLVAGASLTTTNLTLPITTAIRVIDKKDGAFFYGKVDTNDEKISSLDSTAVRIPVDDKYSLEGSLVPLNDDQKDAWMKKNDIEQFLDVYLVKKSGGGGAHNSSFGEQVYLNDSNLPLEVRLIVPYGSEFIKQNLPLNLEYDPLFGFDDDKIATNLNIALQFGKKLTFRSKPITVENYGNLNNKVKDNDIIVIDSIKDQKYIDAIWALFDSEFTLKFYFAATDSMVKALGRKKVYDLALRSDLYVSNEDEFNMVIGKQTPTDELLVDAMKELQNEQSKVYNKRGRIIVTQGEVGSTLYDKDSKTYFQAVAQSPIISPHTNPIKIVNTNGCGDAYFSLVIISEAREDPSTRTLDFANAAGHLCAFQETASGDWMATEKRIENFRKNFGNSQVLFYSTMDKEFKPM